MRPIVEGALRLIRSGGWCQGARSAGRRFSIWGAIDEASGGDNLGIYYVRKLLVPHTDSASLPAWNDHPARTQREIEAVLEKLIGLLGGGVPPRRGWHVTSGVAR